MGQANDTAHRLAACRRIRLAILCTRRECVAHLMLTLSKDKDSPWAFDPQPQGSEEEQGEWSLHAVELAELEGGDTKLPTVLPAEVVTLLFLWLCSFFATITQKQPMQFKAYGKPSPHPWRIQHITCKVAAPIARRHVLQGIEDTDAAANALSFLQNPLAASVAEGSAGHVLGNGSGHFSGLLRVVGQSILGFSLAFEVCARACAPFRFFSFHVSSMCACPLPLPHPSPLRVQRFSPGTPCTGKSS